MLENKLMNIQTEKLSLLKEKQKILSNNNRFQEANEVNKEIMNTLNKIKFLSSRIGMNNSKSMNR